MHYVQKKIMIYHWISPFQQCKSTMNDTYMKYVISITGILETRVLLH